MRTIYSPVQCSLTDKKPNKKQQQNEYVLLPLSLHLSLICLALYWTKACRSLVKWGWERKWGVCLKCVEFVDAATFFGYNKAFGFSWEATTEIEGERRREKERQGVNENATRWHLDLHFCWRWWTLDLESVTNRIEMEREWDENPCHSGYIIWLYCSAVLLSFFEREMQKNEMKDVQIYLCLFWSRETERRSEVTSYTSSQPFTSFSLFFSLSAGCRRQLTSSSFLSSLPSPFRRSMRRLRNNILLIAPHSTTTPTVSYVRPDYICLRMSISNMCQRNCFETFFEPIP